MSEEQKDKIRQSNLGKRHSITQIGKKKILINLAKGHGWNKGLTCSQEWRTKVRLANLGLKKDPKIYQKHKERWTGENNPRWVGGIAYWKEDEERRSSKSIFWRIAVKKRDGWKCYFKNEECSGQIEAHHILPWRDYPELRYDLRNGIALCHFHHPTRGNEDDFINKFCGLVTADGLDKV